MKITSITKKAYCFNEDAYYYKNNFYTVLDGATSLKNNNHKLKTPASLMVKEMVKEFKNYDFTDYEVFLNKLSLKLSNKFDESVSAGVATIIIKNNKLVVYILGDCEALIKLKDGSIINCKTEELSRLDHFAISKMVEISKNENISVKEARTKINDILIMNRNKKNKKDGYYVFEPSKNPKFKVKIFEFELDSVASFLLATDGFQIAYKDLNLYKIEDIFNEDLNDIYNHLKASLLNDPLYNKYPRFKLIDDATAIKVIL